MNRARIYNFLCTRNVQCSLPLFEYSCVSSIFLVVTGSLLYQILGLHRKGAEGNEYDAQSCDSSPVVFGGVKVLFITRVLFIFGLIWSIVGSAWVSEASTLCNYQLIQVPCYITADFLNLD